MICIPIMGRNEALALKAIEKSVPFTDMIELRMDLIRKGNLKELIAKSRSCSPSLKIIVTNRDMEQKGKQLRGRRNRAALRQMKKGEEKIPVKEKGRVALLQEAVVLGCDYVDIELDTAFVLRNELLSTIRSFNNRTKLIVSHHDFKATPALNVLMNLFHACVKAGADLVKIVTYARHPEDNIRILNLVDYARRNGRDVVAFCMGDQGMSSRIMSPFLGSLITFASLRRGSESAPGQLTVNEIRQVFQILGEKP